MALKERTLCLYRDPDAVDQRHAGSIAGARNSGAASKLRKETKQLRTPEQIRDWRARTVLGMESGEISPDVGRSILFGTSQLAFSARTKKQRREGTKDMLAGVNRLRTQLLAEGIQCTLHDLLRETHELLAGKL